MKSKLSVGVLTYNHGKYIEDCLASIFSQTYKDFNVVIIDDASTDDTVQVINDYFEKNIVVQGVQYIQHKCNVGVISKNVNELIRAATGEFLWLISGDDILYENTFEEMIRILECNKSCDIAYANMIAIGDDYRRGDIHSSNTFIKDQEEGIQKNMFNRMLYQDCIPAPAVLYRTSVFEKYGLHDETIYSEDYEYWLRISRYVNYYFYDKPLVLYRRSEKSATVFSTEGGNRRLMKMMDANYKAKKKYIGYVSEEYANVCLTQFFEKYYKECVQINYQEGIVWLKEKMADDQIIIDDRQTDYQKISERLSEEAEILYNWVLKKDDSAFLSNFFKQNDVESVAIYGYSRLGKLLEQEIQSTNVKLKYIVDQKGTAIQSQVPVITDLEKIKDVDLLIVAPRKLISDIREKLCGKNEIKVIDIADIFTGGI